MSQPCPRCGEPLDPGAAGCARCVAPSTTRRFYAGRTSPGLPPGPPPWLPPSPETARWLGVAALVLALVSPCVLVTWPAALLFATLALMHRGADTTARALAIGSVVLSVIALGALAAIAVPNFQKYQARSKAGEATRVLRQLARGEQARFRDEGTYVALPPHPLGAPSVDLLREPVPEAWLALGVEPTEVARLRYRYEAVAVGAAGDELELVARGDLDGDGDPSSYVLRLRRGEELPLEQTEPLE